MIEACFECEEIAEDDESLDCNHKTYRYAKENRQHIDFIADDLEFGKPEGEQA